MNEQHWTEDVNQIRKYLRRRSIQEPITGCWIWQGAQFSAGYGNFGFNRNGRFHGFGAHVLAACVRHGIPLSERPNFKRDQIEASHACHNKICVNPDHIKFEAHVRNMNHPETIECMKLGRRGEYQRNQRTTVHKDWFKTTLDDVLVWLAEYANGKSMYQIAKDHNASRSRVAHTLSGRINVDIVNQAKAILQDNAYNLNL